MVSTKAMALKLDDRNLFPIICNAATRVRFRALGELSVPNFLKAFCTELKKLRIAFEVLKPDDNLLLVGKAYMILVIPADMNSDDAVIFLRDRLHDKGIVLVGLVIQVKDELRWRRVRISEKWLKCLNNAPFLDVGRET